jgi:hypothetical protein
MLQREKMFEIKQVWQDPERVVQVLGLEYQQAE